MKKLVTLGLAAFAVAATPAAAQDRAGSVQVKVLGTFVLPDGKIKDVNVDAVGVPATTQTSANDNFVPTAAIEYFVSNNVSIETIAGVTQHQVTATAGLPQGAQLVREARLLPATVTAKYHFDLGDAISGVKPYVGAGPALFIWLTDRPGADAQALGVTRTNLSNEFGVALQAGVDIALNDSGLGLTLDAKRYFIGTTAQFFAGDALALETRHRLDPWLLSAGIAYRF
ncbi:MAG: OmpW family outer membrane protein [Erythrobacter sp.]